MAATYEVLAPGGHAHLIEDVKDYVSAQVDPIADILRGTVNDISSWSEIAELASDGQGTGESLVGIKVTDNLHDTHTAPAVDYDMPWNIANFEQMTLSDSTTKDVLVLQSHYCLPFATMFDNYEAFYAVPAGGLAAGEYSVSFGNTSAWGRVPASSTYHFTLTNSYSEGAQLAFSNSIYSYAPDTLNVNAYATAGAETASESVTVTSGAGGTSLGTIGTNQVNEEVDDLNHLHRIGLGSNRWKTSAIRQWLNSALLSGWWTPQTKWDRPPSYSAYPGFLSMLPEDLVSVMQEVKVTTTLSYSADGGTASAAEYDVTNDRVWLPSWGQHYIKQDSSYGGPDANAEGEAFGYWKRVAGVSAPWAAGTTHAEYIQRDMTSNHVARSVWMRSCNRSNGYYVADVYASGKLTYSYACSGYFAAPACAIAA